MYATTLINITAAQIAGAQFASTSVVGFEYGRQLRTTMNKEYPTAKALTGKPKRPRLHLAGGSWRPWMRRRSTQPMESIYVDIRARSETEMMMLKAVSEPRVIRHSSSATREER